VYSVNALCVTGFAHGIGAAHGTGFAHTSCYYRPTTLSLIKRARAGERIFSTLYYTKKIRMSTILMNN